jgi:hypothetical protein
LVAHDAGVARQTVYKWCRRADEATPEALHDRASTTHHSAQRLSTFVVARSRSGDHSS